MNGFRVGSIGDIPLYVSPWYVFLALYGGGMTGDVGLAGLWVLCLTLSLLVHELGHAAVARHYRLAPRILLHAFGGLCFHERAERDAHDAWIIAAGPAAGLALGLLALGTRTALAASDSPALTMPLVADGLRWLIFLNLVWTLLNVLPIWPLDGGQLFRLGVMRLARPIRAEQITHGVGIVLAVAALGAAIALRFGGFAMFIAAAIGWLNIQALRGDRSSGPVRSRDRGARDAVALARAAFERGDWSETARLCHVARAEPRVPERMLAEIWRMLGLSTARSGRHREAVTWLRRAPLDAEVGEAWLRCLLAAEADDDIRTLLESPEWARLGTAGQEIVDRLARES